MADLLIKNGRVLDPGAQRDGAFDVLIRDGVVDAIGPDLTSADAKIIDAKNLLVVPGLIDVHLHLMTGLGAVRARTHR
jgi:dihydroorotase